MQILTTPPETSPRLVQFDARPMLAEGSEPLSRILESSMALQDGDVLEVIAPFEPLPLYDVMRSRGFRLDSCIHDDDSAAWCTRFTRVDIQVAHTIRMVLARHPGTRSTLARYALDTCCGAHLTLQQASEAQGVALVVLLAELHTDAVR